MKFLGRISQSGLVLFALIFSGCCCCGFSGLQNTGGGGGTVTTGPNIDPEADKDLYNGTQHAQKALNAKGYGTIFTSELRKDTQFWYVEGDAEGKEGGRVHYIVMFEVLRYDNTQNWKVTTITVDDEIVYP